jgi:MoxR-like ATPase
MVRQDANTKTWAHHWSPFAQVLRRGEPALILIDEINRTESPQALNALLGLLDMTGQLLVPDANDVLTLPAGIMVVATANIGPEFIGTLPLDGAVRQRFGFGVRMEFLPQATEAKLLTRLTGLAAAVATRLVKVADMQRQNRSDMQLYPSGSVISTRLLLDVARRIATCDTDPREALWATLMGQFETGDEAALTVCVETQFPSPDLAALPSMDDDDDSGDADPFTIKVK